MKRDDRPTAPKAKLLVVSDFHLPISGPLGFELTVPPGIDAVVVAGDVTAPVAEAMRWLHENIASQGAPVVYVAGNHEHYGKNYDDSIEGGRRAQSAYPDVRFLENGEFVLGTLRFLGCTLWTDFDLYERPEQARAAALVGMNDYRAIFARDPRSGDLARFTPERTQALHRESRAWLDGKLAEGFDGRTVVVTHHCPHPMSIHPMFGGNPLNPAFTSDLSDLIGRRRPELWVHGHTHAGFDYTVPGTSTRVVCNPRGYVVPRTHGQPETENPAFNPGLVIEV